MKKNVITVKTETRKKVEKALKYAGGTVGIIGGTALIAHTMYKKGFSDGVPVGFFGAISWFDENHNTNLRETFLNDVKAEMN